MADDNWSAKTYSIQFQAEETSNQSNCVVSTVQWRPNIDEVVIFGDHTSKSLARSLPLTHSPHLTSIQRNVNATQLNQSFNQIIHLFSNILI